jgi:hypothetical protein
MKKYVASSAFRDLSKASIAPLFLVWLWLVPVAVDAAPPACFVAIPKSVTYITDPGSPLCRAFGELLNSTCRVVVPICEIKSLPKGSPLSLPNWEPVRLYAPDGKEDAEGFAFLEKLAHRSALVNSEYVSADRFGAIRGTDAADAYAKEILALVRNAKAVGAQPRFERTTLHFAGSKDPEIVYRLYSGRCRQPRQIATWQLPKPGKSYREIQTEPILFRDAVFKKKIPTIEDPRPAHDPNEWAASANDTLLFGGEPYAVNWYSEVREVGDEEQRPYNATLYSGEASDMKCAFEYRQTGE